MSTVRDEPLAGRVALVTGASSGIGAAVARALAHAGASVAANGRDAERLASALADVPGGRRLLVPGDLTESDMPAKVVRTCVDQLGRIDVIVHAAGVFDAEPLERATMECFDRQFAINVRAGYALVLAAVPHLDEGGSILLVSSMCGRVGFPHAAAYCATKGAIELLTKALALELAPRGVRVNAIAPGIIRTELNRAAIDGSSEYRDWLLGQIPARRIGSVEDVAPLAVFLASDAARYVHGASLLVDGGWAAS